MSTNVDFCQLTKQENYEESILVKGFEIYYDKSKEQFVMVFTKQNDHFASIVFDAFDDEINQYLIGFIEKDTDNNIPLHTLFINKNKLMFDIELFDKFLGEFASACIKRDGLDVFDSPKKEYEQNFH